MWLPFLALLLLQSWWMMAKTVAAGFDTSMNARIRRIPDMLERHATHQSAHVLPGLAL